MLRERFFRTILNPPWWVVVIIALFYVFIFYGHMFLFISSTKCLWILK